jgi:hypothetical protein
VSTDALELMTSHQNKQRFLSISALFHDQPKETLDSPQITEDAVNSEHVLQRSVTRATK